MKHRYQKLCSATLIDTISKRNGLKRLAVYIDNEILFMQPIQFFAIQQTSSSDAIS